jgi:hypothetical protein
MFVSFNSSTTGANGVTGTAYPSRLHELTPDFHYVFLCSVLLTIFCPIVRVLLAVLC